MLVLTPETYRKIQQAIKYPSITGGRGVRVTRMPGAGINIGLPGTGGGSGGGIAGGFYPPGGTGDPYDPYAPANPSTVLGPDRPNIYGAGYQP